jgi:hypothetical protein
MLALVGALIALAVIPAFASALIVVDSPGDQAGAARCEPGAAPGECTLRAAIQDVNAHSTFNPIELSIDVFNGQVGTDEIEPATPLPTIEKPTTLFGHPCIYPLLGYEAPCPGVKAPAGAAGLTVAANGVTIEDIAFVGGRVGIEVLEGSTGFKARSDWFGLKLDASAGPIGRAGILLGPGADGATIGGTEASARNVFANAEVGVEIEGASLAEVRGNYIGVGPLGAGTASLETGVRIVDSPTLEARFDEIGGALDATEIAEHECVGACNVIATNEGAAIDLSEFGAPLVSSASGPTKISGNYVGLGADGETLAGENAYGVLAAPSLPGCVAGPGEVTVGGQDPGEANFIEGGSEAIYAEAAQGFNAIGNAIGIAPDGTESASPENVGIGLCDSGVTRPVEVTGNRMSLSPDAIGIESDGGKAQITGNAIQGSFAGISTTTAAEGEGNVISSNAITEPDVYGIRILDDSNVVTGNTIAKSGKYGILIEEGGEHNQIGANFAGDVNTITEAGFAPEGGAIVIEGEESSRNEIAANTGFGNVGPFIQLNGRSSGEIPNGIEPPTITAALQSTASGTGEPFAIVRIFIKASAEPGELGALVSSVSVSPEGKWSAPYIKVPVGTLIAATQTSQSETPQAGTSEVSAPIAAVADPVKPEEPEKEEKGGGGGSGGGGTGGDGQSSGSSSNPGSSTTPPPVAPPPPVRPTAKITKDPKKSSSATTATFRFTATPAAGATFECKLDAAKWAKCKSPRTYRRLEPGRHSFQVRATVPGAPASKPTKFQFTTNP